MQNITSACLEALYNDAVQSIQIHVAPLRGSEFDITENDIVQGGFSYDSYTHDSGMLQIGTMTAAEINVTLENTDGRFNGIWFAGAILTVTLRILLENGQYESIPFGVYTVDEQPRSGAEIDIAALDNMVRLDVPFDPSVFAISLVSEREIVQAAMSACGLQCNDYSMFRNTSDIQLDEIQSESTITWRQVVMWCCQLNCVNGIADENGYICFKIYEKYVPKPLQTEAEESLETEYGDLLLTDEIVENDFKITEAERYMDGSTYDEEDCMITGCQFSDGKDDGAVYPADADMEYGIQITGNRLWAASNQKEQKAFDVNAAITGFTYFPYQCNITPFLHLQLMDGIDYVRNGTHHHSILTHLQFTLNGNMSVAADAQSKTQKGYASLGALTPGQQAIIDSISNKITNTQADLDAREQYLLQFNEAIAGSMGFYTTYKEEEDGSRISYMHDKPTLEESQTIYTFGTNGFAWTNDGWNDGNPVWEYGFDRNGNAILNAIYAYTLTADVITSGILKSQNGASSINLNDGTFCFRAVTGAWMDMDTGEMTYEYGKVLELANKVLSVYGILKSLQYPQYAVSIGPSESGDYGALTVTYDAEGYGDIFQAYPTRWYNESDPDTTTDRGVTITAPFTFSGDDDRKGLQINSNEIRLMNKKLLGSAMLAGSHAWISAFRDNINLSTSASHRHCWFNFYQPKYGYSPIAYDFGNGAGAHADILCAGVECESLYCSSDDDDVGDVIACFNGRITVGGNTFWENTALNVTGDGLFLGNLLVNGSRTFEDCVLHVSGNACAANWYLSSDPELKLNIEEQSPEALKKLQGLKFYSYDINLSGDSNANASAHSVGSTSEQTTKKAMKAQTAAAQTHVKLGIMATEAPAEITTDDGKGISLYSYVSLCAKAIQELSEKCDAQEQRIAALEERFAAFEA